MGKYNVGYHGPESNSDLQGIATLTHDTIATDNIKRPVSKLTGRKKK